VSETILLVEDSRFIRVANERVLVRAGYSVISVADGEQALAMAFEHVPSLVLLDMMLPKLDGVAVLRALKRDSRTTSVPVVVLTGLGQNNEAKLKNEGAAAYFTKSESMLEKDGLALLRLVESVLGHKKTDSATMPTSA
jgi:CheY-like chemotaxis protein